MRKMRFSFLAIALLALAIGCATPQKPAAGDPAGNALIGAWRAKIQFTSGAFASVNDLEFMYVFNLGGTMTESSNYDALPPVPPAYGVWKPLGDRRFVAHYEFYMTRPPDSTDTSPAGSGWLPAGHGVLTDTIVLAENGLAFTSKIHLELFDKAGTPVDGGGEATGQATSIRF